MYYVAPAIKGIEFTRSPSPVGGGITFFRQILVRNWHGETAAGFGITFAQNGVRALDKGKLNIDDNMFKFADGPWLDLTQFSEPFPAVHADGRTDFETYIMWQSSAPGSIPVPLQKLTWFWSFDVTRSDAGGVETWISTPPGTVPGEPHASQDLVGVDWTLLPEWTARSDADQRLYGD